MQCPARPRWPCTLGWGHSVEQWSTGRALARQVADLRTWQAGGWALYRYGSLFGPQAPELAQAERQALTELCL